ncbi:Sec-independent protein translocase protein TatB [Streptomyces sp. NBC_00887]|uniref:Sec-independent protein translocase protein TatB n=1 Tax=Streptomyces sp. NBC_00887 TaxID=2975859 RepID=UPI0038680505|nr:Sec-independent protein translocase protein TatB [Streptomyces sp. NBC_00887]WSY36245.1 Sec-independent protein translocase protein TatB [Streptomyces sp. NBC_00887]
MFFDMGPLEVIAIAVIAIIVLGPEKLPKAIQEVTSVIRKFRSLSQTAQTEIRKELGPEYSDLHLNDLRPRNLTQKAISSAEQSIRLHDLAKSIDLDKIIADEKTRPTLAKVTN